MVNASNNYPAIMKRKLFVQRMNVGELLSSAQSSQVTVPLRCWRYTLEVYSATSPNFQVNGVAIGNIVDQVNRNGFPATYTERVGGDNGQENNVDEQILFSVAPGNPVYASLVVERWQDTN